jgi:putative ABC transport system ATP-binding protein
MTAVIELEQVTKVYQMGQTAVHALRGIDLQVNEREIIAIMGPSGSGKSTLMAILGCLDTPTHGTYRLAGQDVSRMNDGQLATIRGRQIGFVFQTYNLLPRATALENVELPLIYTGAARRRQRARTALDAVGLGDRLSHRPAQLSGGEQQRVAIARALVNEPSIILADEPTGNLDSKTGDEVLDVLITLHKERGLTLVIVTHDRQVAARAETVVHLLDGRLERVETFAASAHRRHVPPGVERSQHETRIAPDSVERTSLRVA